MGHPSIAGKKGVSIPGKLWSFDPGEEDIFFDPGGEVVFFDPGGRSRLLRSRRESYSRFQTCKTNISQKMTWVTNPGPSILRILVLFRPDLQQMLVNEEHDLGAKPKPFDSVQDGKSKGTTNMEVLYKCKVLIIYPLLPTK